MNENVVTADNQRHIDTMTIPETNVASEVAAKALRFQTFFFGNVKFNLFFFFLKSDYFE